MALQYCAHGQARQRNNHDKQRQDSIKGGCMAGSAAERPTAASRVTSVAAVSVAGWSLRARSRICRRCPPPREVGVTKPCTVLVWEWWGGRARGEKIERGV